MSPEGMATIQAIMTIGFNNKKGGHDPVETEHRCRWCSKSCKDIPIECKEFQWDFEKANNIMENGW